MRFNECYVPVCDIKAKSFADLSPINIKPLISKVNSEKMMSEPKHPLSAFMFFMEDFRKEMAGKEPQVEVSAMAKLGSQTWRSMKDVEKQPYMEKQSEARLQYDNAMEEYLEKEEERKKNCITKIVKVIQKDSEDEECEKNCKTKIVKVIYKDSEEEDSSDVDSKKKKYKRTKRETSTKKRYSILSSDSSDNEEDSDYRIDDDLENTDYSNKNKAKKAKKSSDNEEDSDYRVDDDQENTDYSNKNKAKKAKMDVSSDEDSKMNSKIGDEMSEYEKMIERNRAERMSFLQSLKIDEAKASLVEVVQKKKPVKRVFRKQVNPEEVVRRKSNRLAKVNLDLSEEGVYLRALIEAKETEREKQKGRHIPKNLAFQQAMQFEELYETYAKDVNLQESKQELKFFSYDNIFHYFRSLTQYVSHPWKKFICSKSDVSQMNDMCVQGSIDTCSKFITYNKSIITKLTLDDDNIAKVTPERITTLAWYPSPEYLVVAAGSKYGNLGIWNVDSESPYVFRPHGEQITNLKFNPLNKVQLFTSGYDGVLRYGDMVKHVFNELYNVMNEKTSCTYFDFLSGTTCLVAQTNGHVALVDNRVHGKGSQKQHKCHEYPIKTVDVHPVNKNFFITAENRGTVRLWDLRKLQDKPVADIVHHKRCVQSAFFSPVTGNSILTTSADNTIALFDSTKLAQNIKMKQQMKHNNCTGRYLSVFRATWLPNSEEAFFIGSMQSPRRIQVYDKNMDIYHILMPENLSCITSTNAFHPFRPAVAGANSCGKVYVFK